MGATQSEVTVEYVDLEAIRTLYRSIANEKNFRDDPFWTHVPLGQSTLGSDQISAIRDTIIMLIFTIDPFMTNMKVILDREMFERYLMMKDWYENNKKLQEERLFAEFEDEIRSEFPDLFN